MALLDRFRKKPKNKQEQVEKRSAKLVTPQIKDQGKTQSKPQGKKEAVKKVGLKDKRRLAKIYNLLIEPHIAEKATDMTEKGKYIFKVALSANKIEIKKAVEDLYGVKVVGVQTVKMPPKRRRLGRSEGFKKGLKKGFKKAIVTLAAGDKIEIMPR